MSEENMVYSENPYVDVLVHYTKQLITDSIVKDAAEENKYETLQSRTGSLNYMHAYRNSDDPDSIEYTEFNNYIRLLNGEPPIPTPEEEVEFVNGLADTYSPEELERRYPEGKYPTEQMYWIDVKRFRDTTKNPLGPVEEDVCEALGISYTLIPDPLYPDDPDKATKVYDDTPLYLHLMSSEYLTLFTINGYLDEVRELYTGRHYSYVNHLGVKKVPPIKSRMADAFQLLYVPDIDYSDIKQKFEEVYEKNRIYVLRCIYSNAFKLDNQYYDKFITILIKVITMVDMVSEVFNYLIRTDVFDSRTIRFLFESYGVDYYSEIPTRYQIAMIKNMNTLLKYKSTNRNIIDICSLFGCPNLEVFKYYIMKERTSNTLEFNEDGTEAYENNYTLKFIKVPLQEDLDRYTQAVENKIPYDEITSQDPFWYAVDAKDSDVLSYDDTQRFIAQKKREILSKEFSYVRTKYLSIDTSYEVAEMAQQICYFYNMLYDKWHEDIDFTVEIPKLSETPIDIGIVFCFLTAMGFIYNGVEDDIITADFEKNMFVYGFNLDSNELVDMEPGVAWEDRTINNLWCILKRDFDIDISVDGSGHTALTELLNGEEFYFDDLYSFSPIDSLDKFIKILENNLDVAKYVEGILIEEREKKRYDLYFAIYKSLMLREFSTEYYEVNGQVPRTYTDFLMTKAPDLYTVLTEAKSITNDEKRKIYISDVMDNVLYALEEKFPQSEFGYIYNVVPTRNQSFLTQCIIKVVNFFKSYKTQMIGFSAVYKLDDKLDNYIKILEDLEMSTDISPIDVVQPLEHASFESSFDIKDSVDIFERAYITPVTV